MFVVPALTLLCQAMPFAGRAYQPNSSASAWGYLSLATGNNAPFDRRALAAPASSIGL
jgi:hypothetical protein